MRDYAKVGPQFWIGKTGKRLRKAGTQAQVVALYLISSPHANMLGLYYVSLASIAGETGLGEESVRSGLAACVEAGFCSYDEESEMVWVHEMASYQIAEKLDVKDLRCKGVQNEYNSLLDNPFLPGFYDKYARPFHMTAKRDMAAGTGKPVFFEAASKPLPSQEQEQEQEQEQGQEQAQEREQAREHGRRPEGEQAGQAITQAQAMEAPPASARRTAQGSRLPDDWTLPKAWGEWALAHQASWSAEQVRLVADKFRDYWHGKSGREARKADWLATWRNWVRNEKPAVQVAQAARRGGAAAQMTAHRAAQTAAQTAAQRSAQAQADNEEARRILFGARPAEAAIMEALPGEESGANTMKEIEEAGHA